MLAINNLCLSIKVNWIDHLVLSPSYVFYAVSESLGAETSTEQGSPCTHNTWLVDVPMPTPLYSTSPQHAQEGKYMCKCYAAHLLGYLGVQLMTASFIVFHVTHCIAYSLLPTHIPSCCTVSFPVPWGQISGKSWGNPDGRPVLALHGMCEQCKPSCKPALFLPVYSLLLPSGYIVTHLQGGWTMLAVLISSFPYFLKVQLVDNT